MDFSDRHYSDSCADLTMKGIAYYDEDNSHQKRAATARILFDKPVKC